MRPCQVFDTLEDLRKSFSGSLGREGIELSLNDTRTVLDAYQQWLCLAYDLEYLHPDTLRRDAHRLFTDLVKVDVLVLVSAMAECYQLLQLGTYNGFKAHCSIISQHLFSLLKRDFDRMIEGDLYSRKRLMQLFSYMTRLTLSDIDLSQQCVKDYLESEELIPDSYPGALVSELNKIIKSWIGPFVPYEIVPGHGPGGVAGFGRTDLLTKYLNLATDQRLQYSCGANWWCFGPVLPDLDRTSQTIFVPKSYKTFRTISMEPVTLQYFQQGVWKVIDKYVRNHAYLRSHIGFKDQTRNRLLAKEGSLRRNYATIDLSSASDSVGYNLVKALFRGTWLLRFIVTLRSTHTRLPNGDVIQLKKFAPMGSSLCFPIETLIFAAVCHHVTRGLRASGDFSVYGDDIIVPTHCADSVIRALSNLGFRVNLKKSFVSADCDYRESCGGEFVDGFDVTPMRISRKYNANDCCDRFTALISMANEAYKRNFYSLRHFFLRKMRSNGIEPLFAPTSILACSYTNYHLVHRMNKALQREEVRASTIKSKRRASPHVEDDIFHLYEEIRYRHWLQSTYERHSLRYGFESTVCGTVKYVDYQWFVQPDEDIVMSSLDDDQLFDFSVEEGIERGP